MGLLRLALLKPGSDKADKHVSGVRVEELDLRRFGVTRRGLPSDVCPLLHSPYSFGSPLTSPPRKASGESVPCLI